MKKLYSFLLAAMMMVTGTTMAQKDADHPWAGNYTLMIIDDSPYHYLPESAEKWEVATPDTFEVTIEWNANLEKYRVTKFYNLTTDNLKDGAFELQVVDEKTAKIILVNEAFHLYATIPAHVENTDTGDVEVPEKKVTAKLSDGSNIIYSYEPVEVTMNSDGQISIDAFKIIYNDQKSMGWIIWTDGATPLNGGDEPVAIESRDWTGSYWMTIPQYSGRALDGNTYPEEGAFEVKKDDDGNFLVTKFLGYDTEAANAFTGGIYLTPDKKKVNKATIDCGEYMNLLQADDDFGMKGLVLCDGAAENGKIAIEWNEETKTITFDIFYFMHWDAMSGQPATEAAAFFQANAVLSDPAGIKPISTKTIGKTAYDLTGRRVVNPTQKGLYIIDGKKVVFK